MGNLRLTLDKVAELKTMLGDADPDLVHDTIEGETDLFEIVDWLLATLADEEGMEDAIASRVKALGERKSACQGRQQRLRDALRGCLVAAGERSLRRPEATLSLSAKRSAIGVIDESQLPKEFWREYREVDRQAIIEAIKGGKEVPGVTLSNGGESFSVRRK